MSHCHNFELCDISRFLSHGMYFFNFFYDYNLYSERHPVGTVQGLLDWFEVDLEFTQICVAVCYSRCHKLHESSNRKHNALFTQTNSTLIVEHSGLALSHGRTKCYQIKFNQSDLRRQIRCSHVHELSCWKNSVENSLAREFACSGGANQLSNSCDKLHSKFCNFEFVGPLSFRSNMQHCQNFDDGRGSAAG